MALSALSIAMLVYDLKLMGLPLLLWLALGFGFFLYQKHRLERQGLNLNARLAADGEEMVREALKSRGES